MVILLPASNLRADSDFLSSDVLYNYRSYETAKKTSENGMSEKAAETVADADTVEWCLLPYDDIQEGILRSYDYYHVLPKDAGSRFVLSINGTEYPLSDIFDYGELDMLVYSHCEEYGEDYERIILTGLVDLYGSTYFVYRLAGDRLIRLGDFSFLQPADVEETGVPVSEFAVDETKESILITLYIEGDLPMYISLPTTEQQ